MVFLLLWFKDSFSLPSWVGISPLIPLLGVAVWLVLRGAARLRSGAVPHSPRRRGNAWLLIAAAVLLALIVRLPFLNSAMGLMSSDDAVPALMAKHISEGKTPPVYYYGQLYMGAVSEHAQAVFFKIFGFSIFGFKLSILMFFLGFIWIQFRVIEQAFDRSFAAACSFFYVLPIGYTISLSLDTTGAFPLVMLLGALMLRLSGLIGWENRSSLAPWLGFVMGLAFWTHQIAVGFILTTGLLLLARARLKPGRWLELAAGFGTGSLPVLLMEAHWGFPLVRFLLPNAGEAAAAGKGARLIRLLLSLFSFREHPLRWIPLVLAVFGCVWLVVQARRARRFHLSLAFPLFFTLFLLMYGLSGFSGSEAVRYLYPLYLCLPVLLLVPFRLLPKRFRLPVSAAALILLSGLGSAPATGEHISRARRAHADLRKTLDVMTATGECTWRGEYWTAYLLTAISKEKLVVASTTVDRYFPYQLEAENSPGPNNFVFPSSEMRPGGAAAGLTALLRSLQVEHRVGVAGRYVFVYGIPGPVFPGLLRASVPERIPEFRMTRVEEGRGFLTLEFNAEQAVDPDGFGFHAEIPHYSSAFRRLQPGQTTFNIRLPGPESAPVELVTSLDYEGLPLPVTVQRSRLSISPGPPGRRVVPLDGLGTSFEQDGRRLRVLTKSAAFRIGRMSSGARIRIDLISPFDFEDPYWYGSFQQKVSVSINGNVAAEQRLAPGFNRIEIAAPDTGRESGPHRLTLHFRHHAAFPFAPLWKTAALLDTIEIE